MEAVGETGRKRSNPRVSTNFSLSMENGQADVGRDDRTCSARVNSQAQMGTEKVGVQPTTSRIGDHTG